MPRGTSNAGAASVVAAMVAVLGVPASAAADARLVVRGAGYGHGVGLSQFGAKGMAERGRDHAEILRHYFRGTRLGTADTTEVRVLVQTDRRIRFSGATAADGMRSLQPGVGYSVTRAPSGRLTLRSPAGKRLDSTTDGELVLRGGPAGIRLAGRSGFDVTDGGYRGDMELRPVAGGIQAVNVVDLEDYVKGVVAGEVPSRWPLAALRAQAIIARTYAATTGKGGNGFDQYSDTRSQVYNGIAGETAASDAAVEDTQGRVVTYGGAPVVTYYFSTSGGRTENVENVFIGDDPKPWLRSVRDPDDRGSPKHAWVRRMTVVAAERRLGGLVKGRLRGIRVLDRGRSPRIVRALVVGTEGVTRVTGPELRTELGLLDTWATFTLISAERGRRPGAASDRAAALQRAAVALGPARPEVSRLTGGTLPRLGAPARTARPRYAGQIRGRVAPARAGAWVAIQRRAGRRWTTVFETPAGAGGRYRALVRRPGVYRVQYRRERGPVVRIRGSGG